jgi:serine/threonine-protein kinase RsbW
MAQLMIAFDEIISNGINHGGEGRSPTIEIRLVVEDEGVSGEVADDGKPFDPLAAPKPDTTLPVEQRPIGGLGIHLVRELMDDVSYLRDGGRNRLRFSKTCRLE